MPKSKSGIKRKSGGAVKTSPAQSKANSDIVFKMRQETDCGFYPLSAKISPQRGRPPSREAVRNGGS